MMTPNVNCLLSVAGGQYLSALQLLNAQRQHLRQAATFTCEDGQLVIDAGGATVRIDATGTWRGRAQIPAETLLAVIGVPPPSAERIEIACDGEKLRIGPNLYPCKWSGLIPCRVELPLGANLSQTLELLHRYSAEDIALSGLEKPVAAAREEREELLVHALEKANELRLYLQQLRLDQVFGLPDTVDQRRTLHEAMLHDRAQT